MDRLKTLLDVDGIEYSEIMFESSENVADIGSRLFVSLANNAHQLKLIPQVVSKICSLSVRRSEGDLD